MSDSPRVTALVLNYNLGDVTLACVRSLLSSTYANLRVVVVDSCSTDGSPEALSASLGDTATILRAGANRYYAAGMNLGLRYALAAGCDLALVMNNDTLVHPDMVRRLVAAATTQPAAGIVSPRIDADGRIWSLGARRRRGWPFAQELARRASPGLRAQVALRVDYVTGCAMLLSRRLLEDVGLFDESYLMYYEDADLCERARATGYGIYVVPEARMMHLVAASARRQAPHMAYLHARNRARFYRQHHQPRWPLGHALAIAQETLRAAWDRARGRRDVATARWRGLRDGWRRHTG